MKINFERNFLQASILIISTLFILSYQVCSAEDFSDSLLNKESEFEEIAEKIIDTWESGYNSGNTDIVGKLYAENAYYLTQHYAGGIIVSRDSIKAYVQLGVDAKFHIDQIKIITVHHSGNFGYVITKYESTNNGEKNFGVNLVVLEKINGQWLIVAHEAAVPDPKSSIKNLKMGKYGNQF